MALGEAKAVATRVTTLRPCPRMRLGTGPTEEVHIGRKQHYQCFERHCGGCLGRIERAPEPEPEACRAIPWTVYGDESDLCKLPEELHRLRGSWVRFCGRLSLFLCGTETHAVGWLAIPDPGGAGQRMGTRGCAASYCRRLCRVSAVLASPLQPQFMRHGLIDAVCSALLQCNRVPWLGRTEVS